MLNHYLFEELGFSGNTADYYDPRNSFLNDVIERRLGIPITLSVVYIEVGRRVGLPLHGVSFPAHFLVKCVVREGAIVLDPYAKGVSLGLKDLVRRLKSWRNGIEPDGEVRELPLRAAVAELGDELHEMHASPSGADRRRGERRCDDGGHAARGAATSRGLGSSASRQT